MVNHLAFVEGPGEFVDVGVPADFGEGKMYRGWLVTWALDGSWSWNRIAALIYHWLCICSCLSAAGPFVSLRSDSESPTAHADLDTQLEDILDCVWREERIWRVENRVQASLGDMPREQPPSRSESDSGDGGSVRRDNT